MNALLLSSAWALIAHWLGLDGTQTALLLLLFIAVRTVQIGASTGFR